MALVSTPNTAFVVPCSHCKVPFDNAKARNKSQAAFCDNFCRNAFKVAAKREARQCGSLCGSLSGASTATASDASQLSPWIMEVDNPLRVTDGEPRFSFSESSMSGGEAGEAMEVDSLQPAPIAPAFRKEEALSLGTQRGAASYGGYQEPSAAPMQPVQDMPALQIDQDNVWSKSQLRQNVAADFPMSTAEISTMTHAKDGKALSDLQLQVQAQQRYIRDIEEKNEMLMVKAKESQQEHRHQHYQLVHTIRGLQVALKRKNEECSQHEATLKKIRRTQGPIRVGDAVLIIDEGCERAGCASDAYRKGTNGTVGIVTEDSGASFPYKIKLENGHQAWYKKEWVMKDASR